MPTNPTPPEQPILRLWGIPLAVCDETTSDRTMVCLLDYINSMEADEVLVVSKKEYERILRYVAFSETM